MRSDADNSCSYDIRTWAYINFQLQAMICKETPSLSKTMKDELITIGYDGAPLDKLNTIQREEVLATNAFFGYMQTGHRIIAFALKKNGLNREMFDTIHESIRSAYEEVIQTNGHHQLLESSYRHTLQTLSVFRP